MGLKLLSMLCIEELMVTIIMDKLCAWVGDMEK